MSAPYWVKSRQGEAMNAIERLMLNEIFDLLLDRDQAWTELRKVRKGAELYEAIAQEWERIYDTLFHSRNIWKRRAQFAKAEFRRREATLEAAEGEIANLLATVDALRAQLTEAYWGSSCRPSW